MSRSAAAGNPIAASLPPDPGMAVVADPQYVPAVVVALPAEIGMASAGRVGEQPGAALAPGVRTVIAGLTATPFCDSSGISMLVRAVRQAACRTELRLAAPATAGRRVFTLAGTDLLLAICPGLSQALAAGPGPAPPPPPQ